MVGQVAATTKLSRSDNEVIDADEEIRITNQIKTLFDALRPKRPMKPNRSEPESPNFVNSTLSPFNIPELEKLQSLQASSRAFPTSQGLVVAQDEFVETQYYNELLSIDKQHYATGSGFINAVREEGESGNEIQLPDVGKNQIRGYKSNPATNDWVPNLDHHHEDFVSTKPSRSESI